MGAKTPSPPQPPPSAAVRHPIHPRPPPPCRADTPTPPSITRDQPLSSTASDRDPCIPSSRFIPAVVHLAGAAPTTISSTAPRRHLSLLRPPPHPPPSSSTMPELIPRCRRPLQEIDLSHPRLRTGILASRPLASSPPSSTLPAPLLRPSRPSRPAATVYPPRSASTPSTAIATAAPSNSQQMCTRRRTRGGTLSYLLNLFIAARK